MVKPSTCKRGRWRDDYVLFECAVARLLGPVIRGRGIADYIRADIEMPEQYRHHAMLGLWNEDGTYRVEVLVNHNAKTLAPFIASGDLQWDVRERQ